MRLIIFDMDGTLIDSVALIVETVVATFEAVGHTVPDERAIRSISGITAREALAILAPDADEERIEALLHGYRSHYLQRAGLEREPLFPGALDALNRLQRQPDTTLAIATGKSIRGATKLLEVHGLGARFASVQTPDHNRGKPDPQMLETAMNLAGATAAETVMIGDTVHDMRMARSAGVGAIGVAWGYHQREELHDAGAHVVLESFDELDAAIDRLLG